ncbi:MAG: ABC transporter ATP-binding protein [Bacteroidota bacterium]|nr:ABC transporter ATP-binding protein [Bacteroidota bacterium]
MRDILVILGYGKKYRRNVLANLVLNVFSIFFALFSFTLLIPFLQLLFEKQVGVQQPPEFQLNVDSLKESLFYELSRMIDDEGKLYALFAVSIMMITAGLFKNVFRYFASFVMAPVMSGTIRDFQEKIYHKILELPISYFSNEKKGDIMSRASNDITELRDTVTNTLEVLARDPITIIIFLMYLVYFSPSLTVFVIIFIPVIGIIIGLIGKSLKRKSLEAQQKTGHILSVIEETLGGLRIIKAFNAEEKVKNWYNRLTSELFGLNKGVIRRNSLSVPVSEFLGTLVIVGIVLFGGSLILGQESELTGEEFITYIVVFSQILTPAKSLSRAYNRVKKGAASIERINEILNARNDITESPNPKSVAEFSRAIEFRNVSFKYGESYVLKNINLKVEKGKTVALVGQSGSGKSTMVDLLPRFFDIEEGEILIDGINIKDLSIQNLRSLMGNVNQEAVLFNDTIAGNILFGAKDATEKEIIDAAKIANAHPFILNTEKKYETNIGDRGSKLSGGQRQRLSIARAILKNPPILILDEATSALDTESEKIVQEALDNLMKNRTSVVIAHRLSTIKNADEICVLQDGVIVERGNHEILIKQQGAYKKLYDLQMI